MLYQLDIALQVVLLVAAGPDIGGDSGGLIAVPLVQVELHGDGLARVDRGRKHGAVPRVGKIIPGIEGLIEDLALVTADHAVHQDGQRAGAGIGVLGAVLDPAEERVGHTDVVGAAGKLEIKVDLAGAIAVSQCLGRLFAGKTVAQHSDLAAEGGDIQNIQIAGDTGADDAVIDGSAIALGEPLETTGYAHDSTHVAGVTVRIPTGHGSNFHRAVKGSAAVQQGHDAHAGVGDNVAGALILIVSPILDQHLVAVPPVFRMLLVEGAHGVRHSAVGTVGGDLGKTGVDQLVHIAGLEGLCNGGAHETGAPDAVAVVRDAGSSCTVVGSTLRLAGIDKTPGVNKDLAADLLGQNRAVLLDGAGSRCGDAVFQVEVGGVLGADTVAAPPEHTDSLTGIVEPRPGNVLGGQRAVLCVVDQSTQKIHRSICVIICGKVFVFLYVACNIAVCVADAIVGPDRGLYRRA